MNIEFTEELIEEIDQNNVRLYPVEQHAIHHGRHLNKVIMGYGNLSEENIKTGISRLKESIIQSL